VKDVMHRKRRGALSKKMKTKRGEIEKEMHCEERENVLESDK
jgi:hypothetical protein